jgi:ribosomal protein S18 acetylase RimI-like enzyme
VTGAARLAKARAILVEDRRWAAYALADLEPEHAAHSSWWIEDRSLILVYAGLTPPVLFAFGEPVACARLMPHVPFGQYTFTLPIDVRGALTASLHAEHETAMWRMALIAEPDPAATTHEAVRLGPSDLAELNALFGEHPDRPDSFHPRQLAARCFYGVRRKDQLVSVAGTHVVSETESVAGIGNVFTHPAVRDRGFAREATAAVIGELVQRGISTIVLNVAQSNAAAIRCYHQLGFRPHCAYAEGVGHLRRAA